MLFSSAIFSNLFPGQDNVLHLPWCPLPLVHSQSTSKNICSCTTSTQLICHLNQPLVNRTTCPFALMLAAPHSPRVRNQAYSCREPRCQTCRCCSSSRLLQRTVNVILGQSQKDKIIHKQQKSSSNVTRPQRHLNILPMNITNYGGDRSHPCWSPVLTVNILKLILRMWIHLWPNM